MTDAPPYPPSPPSGDAAGAPDADDSRTFTLAEEQRPSWRHGATSWAITIAVAVVLTILVRSFLLTAYSIPSPSMEPTLMVGDRVVVFQLNRDPARGDIVVFDRPPNDPKNDESEPDVLIKRVIGLPGETIDAQDGHVYVNGRRLTENYLPDGTTTEMTTSITVPEGKILVLGDNRSNSKDGRIFGPISKDLIVGRAILRIWPPSDIGGL